MHTIHENPTALKFAARHFIRGLFTLVLCLRLTAEEQLVTVTPQTLEAWTVLGADRRAIIEQEHLILPAGSEIGRAFPSQTVILRLLTRPVFSESPAEWPILEVGPATLALISKDGQRRAVLVIGEQVSLDLPVSAPEYDQSAGTDLILAYDPETGAGLIRLQDSIRSFEAGQNAKPVEMALLAGSNSNWPVEVMEVLLLPNDPAGSEERTSAREAEARLRKLIDSRMSALSADGGSGGGSGSGSGSSAAAVENKPTPAGTGSTLEVFTPSSVRRARIETARAIIARSQGR